MSELKLRPPKEGERRSSLGVGAALQGIGEKHVGGLEVLALAVIEVEDKIVLEDIVAVREAEFAGGLVDGGAGAFELSEGADGGFVEIDDDVFGPFQAGRKTVRGAEFFVAEPAFEAQTFEDFLERSRIGEDDFDLLADFVAALGGSDGADGELLGRGFEGEDGAGGGVFGGGFALGLGGGVTA